MKEKQFINKPKDVEELWPLVVEECRLIKENFTEAEIQYLQEEVENIQPNSESRCIYGTMTSNCNSSRVTKFIEENLLTLIKSSNYGDNLAKRSAVYVTPLEDYIYDDYNDYDFDDEVADGVSEEAKERIQKVLSLLK